MVVDSKSMVVGCLIFGEKIYLLFLQHSCILKDAFIMSLDPLMQVGNKNTILFGSMLLSSNKWVVGVHGNGGVIYEK
jgi:hypothetical protein